MREGGAGEAVHARRRQLSYPDSGGVWSQHRRQLSYPDNGSA